MSKPWTCGTCGAQLPGGRECPDCGTMRPPRRAAMPAKAEGQEQALCICGAPLNEGRLCSATGLSPLFQSCRYVCPICRGRLEWSGACLRCYGTRTGRRADWAFPGQRHEVTADACHWAPLEGVAGAAGRDACVPEENAARMSILKLALAPIGSMPGSAAADDAELDF